MPELEDEDEDENENGTEDSDSDNWIAIQAQLFRSMHRHFICKKANDYGHTYKNKWKKKQTNTQTHPHK